MSRARPYTVDGTETIWFDNRAPAAAKHLELLADVEEVDLDDIFEGDSRRISQKEVLKRLHEAGGLIPEGVLELRRERKQQSQKEPECRICSNLEQKCEGRITRHHFVPKWLMRELGHYNRYAARSKCTIPVCVGRHRDLHYRGDHPSNKSIVKYLTEQEKKLAEQMLRELKEERPAIFELLLGGDANAYEYQLVRDFTLGRFHTESEEHNALQGVTIDRSTAVAVGQAGA